MSAESAGEQQQNAVDAASNTYYQQQQEQASVEQKVQPVEASNVTDGISSQQQQYNVADSSHQQYSMTDTNHQQYGDNSQQQNSVNDSNQPQFISYDRSADVKLETISGDYQQQPDSNQRQLDPTQHQLNPSQHQSNSNQQQMNSAVPLQSVTDGEAKHSNIRPFLLITEALILFSLKKN